MVLTPSPQLSPLHLRIPQNISRIFHSDIIEEQICSEITARDNHSFCKLGNFGNPSNALVQLRHCIRVAAKVKRRAVCHADKPVSNGQRAIQSKPAFICCPKNRHEYCDLNCACCVEPAITL